jgi:hypothetical protein
LAWFCASSITNHKHPACATDIITATTVVEANQSLGTGCARKRRSYAFSRLALICSGSNAVIVANSAFLCIGAINALSVRVIANCSHSASSCGVARHISAQIRTDAFAIVVASIINGVIIFIAAITACLLEIWIKALSVQAHPFFFA